MAEPGLGYGRPAETDTGIAHVLSRYAAQGGDLYGARRWDENPLTLTHVRWQGPDGSSAEAYRRPDAEDNSTEAERTIWLNMALAMPTGYGAVSGRDAPWLPLAVGRQQAMEWDKALRHAQLSRKSNERQTHGWQSYGSMLSIPRMPAVDSGTPRRPVTSFGPPYTSGPFPESERSGYTSPRPSVPSAPIPMDMEPTMQFMTAPSAPARPIAEERQFTGSWQRGRADAPEVVVVPCVDVELPPAMGGGAYTDYRRDFARDVAMHFSRAARSIPQVREVRGWMRGDRMVLAARFVVAVGNRPPTRAEMDGAAQILADGLAQRTLPYARLSFADPGEWIQGAPLPE